MEKYEKILDELGIKMSIKGYAYWVTAIDYCINIMNMTSSNSYDFSMSDVYNYVAEKHNTTYSRAERALRHAIESTPGITEEIHKKLNIDYKLKNSVFLACLVRIARMEM